ncbi:MAG: hypothetical protein QHH26_03180 [Armatimonadota bacterium]|nr:hypothetical protein [Armatimonadota bacterium]
MHLNRHLVCWVLLVLSASLVIPALCAQEEGKLVRGIVVDRSEKLLWLGLPEPVKKGTVFNIMVMPNSKVIAKAIVTECTPDEPYVAKAKFVLEEKGAFVSVGAYAEAVSDAAVKDRDKIDGYQEVELGPKGINPLSFSIGVFYPLESSLRRETATLWPAVQIGYQLCKKENTALSLSIGYFHGDGSFTLDEVEGSRDFRLVPLILDVKFSEASQLRGAPYFKAGIGAFYVKDERSIGGAEDKLNVVTLGWRLGLGYQSKKGRHVELTYTDAARSDFKGLTFKLGARF